MILRDIIPPAVEKDLPYNCRFHSLFKIYITEIPLKKHALYTAIEPQKLF
jgi:hypothetical protein